jgi:inner membrane protein
MDNLTHTLTGLMVARAGLHRTTPGATLALALASNLPDLDVIAGLGGTAAYLEHHRGLTHSVLGAPLLALLLAAALRRTVGGSRFPALLACASLGTALHVVMDLWTTYGTRVLAPFDAGWHSWDIVFVVDGFILLFLLVPFLARRTRQAAPRLARLSLALILAYVGGRTVLHTRAVDAVAAQVPSGPVLRAAAFPSLDPLHWRVLADTPGAYFIGEMTLAGRPGPLERRPKTTEDALVARVRASSEVAAIFLEFSRFPLLEVKEIPEGTAVTWRDLRFEAGGRERFVTKVVVGPDGGIRSQEFRF